LPATIGQGEALLGHARLHYDDASLTERLLRINAAKQGIDTETLRLRLVAQGEQEAAAMVNNPAMAAATRAIGAFLRSPRSVLVEVTPPCPLRFAAMRDLNPLSEEQFFNSFGFSITTLPGAGRSSPKRARTCLPAPLPL